MLSCVAVLVIIGNVEKDCADAAVFQAMGNNQLTPLGLSFILTTVFLSTTLLEE